jgi:translation initiation factor 3 subunit E
MSEVKINAKFDITQTIAPYLDLHLMFPLLEFLGENQMYSEKDLLKAKLDLLQPTNMVEYAMEIYGQLHETEDIPAEMTERKDKILEQLTELQGEAQPLLEICQSPGENQINPKMQALVDQKKFTPAGLAEEHSITEENIKSYYKYAKFMFDCGQYQDSLAHLVNYGLIVEEDPEASYQALWGRFAAELLVYEWSAALEDLHKLKDAIEARTTSTALQKLQERTWLIHWSLFVFFNHPDGKDEIVDFLLKTRYQEAIQTNCPWVLRYLTTAIITQKTKRREKQNVLKNLITIIQQEQHSYSDPITEFLECLYVRFDFEGAQERLKDCETVLVSDFFLVFCHDDFMDNAREFIFETYCQIHQKIDIKMLASRLNMNQDDAEKWIVELIRGARLDAKIDSSNDTVIMGAQFPTIYEQVIDTTKDLAARSYVLASNIESLNRASRSA